jgi:hypothetical protein
MRKKTEPTPTVRELQAQAAADYAHHHDPDTTRTAKDRQAEVRDNAAANLGFFGRRK